MTGDEELLAIKASVLYYEDGKTQDEIGALLGLSRWKVGRLLSDAKTAGFVRIEIVHPRARKLELERRLRQEMGLVDAVVVPSLGQADSDELQSRVALAAAEYLTSARPVPRTLGISWGRTLHDVAQQLRQDWATGVNVVQINGGVSLNKRASSAANTTATIAQKGGGEALLLPSPAILERAETKRIIENDRTVAQVLTAARSASAFLFSAGLADSSSVLVDSGYLTRDDVRILVQKGAVGDVLGRFVDANGNVVDPALDERTVGITIDELRAAHTSIAVISGRSKNDICRVLVSSGICTVLVTDEGNARYLLEGKQ
ncbi:sugar-binding transcriptional regulator [Klugiella xanthotipulae]|uniref:Deoxyribonucleoside regulator n=1 Tax=Klugiella xanthotipulae TaxID=244735 RepID=A0A543HXP9_9MICO|nr:sugar-binding transcriptional regulator [Klugiella xanthotipulae]TQM63117.1 deoxyribonucleoside regulator [Klugiella xanthotipulae]